MDHLFDSVLGFLPHRSVFWTGIGIALLVFLFQYLTGKIVKLIELPHMKVENQEKRKKIEQQVKR